MSHRAPRRTIFFICWKIAPSEKQGHKKRTCCCLPSYYHMTRCFGEWGLCRRLLSPFKTEEPNDFWGKDLWRSILKNVLYKTWARQIIENLQRKLAGQTAERALEQMWHPYSSFSHQVLVWHNCSWRSSLLDKKFFVHLFASATLFLQLSSKHFRDIFT